LKKDQAVNILLIDMGAGTTDLVLCSYTPGKNAQILSAWPKGGEIFFGGKEIDDKLPQFFRDEKVIEPQEILETTLKRLGSSEFKAWKENTVSPVLEHNDVVSEFTAFENHINLLQQYANIVEKDYALDRTAFEKVLGKDLEKFPQLVNGCLADAKVPGSDVDLVILTGGHSQWYFVKEMLAGKMPQYGKLELTKVIADPSRMIQFARPQETVARGLVYTPLCGKEIVNPEDLYQQGLELEKSDPEKANELYLQAAELGHTEAMIKLGFKCRYGVGGMTKNPERAVDWYRKAAELGDVQAIYDLALCYRNQLKNPEKAVELYRKTADLGQSYPMFLLGKCYENGDGVSKNQEKANKWYQKAAELGMIDAMYSLGYNLIYGYQETPVNARLGLEWIRKAADLGHKNAKKYTEYTPENDFYIKDEQDGCIITKYKGNDRFVNVPPVIQGRKVVKIGNRAFENSRERGFFERIGNNRYEHLSQVEIVMLPSNVTDIEPWAFPNCMKLRLLVAPGVRVINAFAFYYCRNLQAIILSQNTISIGTDAFCGCEHLSTLDFGDETTKEGVACFPKTMVSIGYNAFHFCPIYEIRVSKNTNLNEAAFDSDCKVHYYED